MILTANHYPHPTLSLILHPTPATREEADLFPAPAGPIGYTDPALSMSTAPPTKAKQGSVHQINCELNTSQIPWELF